MALPAPNGPTWRKSPFSRASPSQITPKGISNRPVSAILSSPASSPSTVGHARHQSFSPLSTLQPGLARSDSTRKRSGSYRSATPATGTFAPTFIKTEDAHKPITVNGIEGENDFSGKRYVWLKDADNAFVKGWVMDDLTGGRLLVQCDDGSQREVDANDADKVNPAKFDKADDMAELTHLNEASVVHNLHTRYQADLIYTYSGLFLVAVNPYCALPIYSREYVNMYRGCSREDTKPHIFAVADEAFRNLVEEGQNQSILVTGESGAGKTENTKKVIQYLAAVATTDTPRAAKSSAKHLSNLSEQILRANPILEAFGNAQTVRNNNSSRFGKFIRIEFTRSGQIAGAYIDWYLLEKSRVVRLNPMERNYHVFYQLLRGADARTKRDLRLSDKDIEDFQYTRQGNDTISGVSDLEEWNSLVEAFHVMGFSEKEQSSILRTIATVLYLGNISIIKESVRADQAAMDHEATQQSELVAQLLGIPPEQFINGLLHPKVKAGREWVEKVQTPEQVKLAIDALAKGIYERQFGDLVTRINRQLNRLGGGADDSHYIGVLDIAGFEIFEENSFEQLCINYTNEKLQQFFNHHMFVLEQEEYAREQIEWKFIDFGKDLQPTINLIELSNPIGIFSCLDEDSVMPKATDSSFTDKLHSLWDRKTPKYRRAIRQDGFILTHYAAEVEYSTDGWLEKNKDPLNDNVTRLLAESSDKHIANLFADCAESEDDPGSTKSRVKKGLFRTVAQRHKEQLSTLMGQLHSTHPHFVRCIIPNHKKRSKFFDARLVLDQLRCNGVLEGIRIARTGFPNRLTFTEFRSRYEVLCSDMPKSYIEGQLAVKMMLEKLNMDSSFYRVGLTKVFFRAGVLADLEERRDALISAIMTRFQSLARGFVQRRAANKRLYRAEATRIVQRNFQVYLDLQANPWWRLFVRMKPLLGASRQAAEVKKRDDMINQLHEKVKTELSEKQRLDDERRRAENDIQRIQHTLESERALALDKEEIFKRLQNRETELREELQGVLEDQEKLEDELDAVLEAKKKADDEAATWRREVEQASVLVSKLESEKQDLREKIRDLNAQIEELEVATTTRTEAEEHLQKEIKMLQSHLSLKERKLQDLESKIVKSGQDLEVKLATATKELNANKKQVRDLQDENKKIRQQMTELTATSTSFEDLIRQKESELALLKSDVRKHESDRHALESERRSLTTKHDSVQSRLRDMQTELETLQIQKAQAERSAADSKRLLEQRISDDEGRKVLERQVDDLKAQIVKVQTDLTRERQSRDDVQMLGDHKYSELKRNFDSLNESKITIEKELYAQQDVLRRATESRTTAEVERREFQNELRGLREKFLALQEAKLEAESTAESRMMKVSNERQAAMRRDLEARDKRIEELSKENAHLADDVQGLTNMLADTDVYRSEKDQEKERLAREVNTLKGRLAASENDNRALLNKIQQKNLDIARSNSRAGETQRGRIAQLTTERAKADDEAKRLHRQLEDAQLTIKSLEKQKEKLSLGLEDLTHEVNREHKTSRNAEKLSSTASLQLAEANRRLETERQLRAQAQANTRAVQGSLDAAQGELSECRQQLMALRKVFDPSTDAIPPTYEAAAPGIARTVDLAQRLDAAQQALRVAHDRNEALDAQLAATRARMGSEMAELDARHADGKRALLEEMTNSSINARGSPRVAGTESRKPAPGAMTPGSTTTPRAQRQINDAAEGSARSDRTADSAAFGRSMDLAAEVEMLQNQLQLSEMRCRHLQGHIEAGWGGRDDDGSPSVRRMKKLERENTRLNERLDDSSKKVSVLEHSLRSGQMSLKDVQAKSHEELCDYINSQQRDRRDLGVAYNALASELVEAKSAFEDLKSVKAHLESELREASTRLSDTTFEREQEAGGHAQLLQEFSDLQIRLDGETAKLEDAAASAAMHKSRSDEYFNRLEQAEMAVLKATRAEQFAKSQAKEVEDTCATLMSERKALDSTIEDLQRQTQKYEERIEDMSADLEGALQAKRRLQNELEDYRSQRAHDIEDKEGSFEQARKKYQSELTLVNNELEQSREDVIREREENGRLREEVEDLRGKWDDEMLNSSTWSKEKRRLEVMMQELGASRDESVAAHNEAQGKVVTLLSQVRELRTAVMSAEGERDALLQEKGLLGARLAAALERLDEAMRGSPSSARDSATLDREVLELRARVEQAEDVNAAAVSKMRSAEKVAGEAQAELQAQRDGNVQLHKDKAALEKAVKDLSLKVVDLETKGYSSASQDVRFLHGRIQELEKSLEAAESARNSTARSTRSTDRTLRDLQAQLDRRAKLAASLEDDLARARDRHSALLARVEELEAADAEMGLAARRGERELREERERALRLERELEGWKGLRFERSSVRGPGSVRVPSWGSGVGSVRGRREGSVAFAREGSVQPAAAAFAREASVPLVAAREGSVVPGTGAKDASAAPPPAVVPDAEGGAGAAPPSTATTGLVARALRRLFLDDNGFFAGLASFNCGSTAHAVPPPIITVSHKSGLLHRQGSTTHLRIVRSAPLRCVADLTRYPDLQRNPAFSTVTPDDIATFRTILDSDSAVIECVTSPAAAGDLAGYNTDWMGKYRGASSVVLRPSSTAQVQKILAHCDARRLAVVPQGGNTGLVGGSVPVFDEVVVSTARMSAVRAFDANSGILVADAGLVLEAADGFLQERGYVFPLDLGAKGSCHIGGNVSTNAGGLRLLRYGSLHGTVLGVEAVLADGTLVDDLSTLRKNNTGYDMKQLFIGAEGTIGIITGVSILCPPKSSAVNVAYLGLKSFDQVLTTFLEAKKNLGEILSAFELMDWRSQNIIRQHRGLDRGVLDGDFQFFCLIETRGSNEEADYAKVEDFLGGLLEKEIILDGTIAQDQTQVLDLWKWREGIPESLGRWGGCYKYDLSVPLTELYDLVDATRERLTEAGLVGNDDSFPVVDVVGYGHMGDGNLHLNVPTRRFDKAVEKQLEPFVYEWVSKRSGSISAEHGLGIAKKPFIGYSRSDNMISLMKRIKQTFDPNGIMNPYKYIG